MEDGTTRSHPTTIRAGRDPLPNLRATTSGAAADRTRAATRTGEAEITTTGLEMDRTPATTKTGGGVVMDPMLARTRTGEATATGTIAPTSEAGAGTAAATRAAHQRHGARVRRPMHPQKRPPATRAPRRTAATWAATRAQGRMSPEQRIMSPQGRGTTQMTKVRRKTVLPQMALPDGLP